MWADVTTGSWDEDFIERLLVYLGYDGVAFFEMCIDEYGTVSPVWQLAADGGSPKRPRALRITHPVHFREGMQVRNAMRRIHREMGLGVYGGAHFYDNHWMSAVKAALTMCKEGRYEPAGTTTD